MTPGDILFVDYPSSDKFQLHTYHTGGSQELYDNLKGLPEWMVSRALLVIWQYDKNNELDKERKWGLLGPWLLHVWKRGIEFGNADDDFEDSDFEDSWRTNLGVNLIYCNASMISGLMVQRHFDRWYPSPIKDNVDFVVHCNGEEGWYEIEPSVSTTENNSLTKHRVDWAGELYQAFRREAENIQRNKFSDISDR